MNEAKPDGWDDFSQEADDLIDATVEDFNAARAVQRMEAAIDRIPIGQAAAAYQVLGSRYEDLGDVDKAIECYAKSLEINRGNPIVLVWRGELLFQRGRLQEAKTDLEDALRVDLSGPGLAYEREKAEKYLERILKSDKP